MVRAEKQETCETGKSDVERDEVHGGGELTTYRYVLKNS